MYFIGSNFVGELNKLFLKNGKKISMEILLIRKIYSED